MGWRHWPPPRGGRPLASDTVGRGCGRRLLPFRSTAKQTLLLAFGRGSPPAGQHRRWPWLWAVAAVLRPRCAATGKPLPPVESHCYMPTGSHCLPSTTGGPQPPPLNPVVVWSSLSSLVGRATLPFVAATAETLKRSNFDSNYPVRSNESGD